MPGFHEDAESKPPKENIQNMVHEDYFELCALATTGTLTDSEWTQLKSHVLGCTQCSELLQKYREVARTAMPLLISEESVSGQDWRESWTPEFAKEELFARIARGEQVGWSHDSVLRTQRSDQRTIWNHLQMPSLSALFRYAASFAMALIVIGLVYEFGIRSGRRIADAVVRSAHGEATIAEQQMEELKQERAVLGEQLILRNKHIEALAKEVEATNADLARWKALQRQAEVSLEQQRVGFSEAKTENSSVIAERDSVARKLQDTESSLASMKSALDRLSQERAEESLRTTSLEMRIADLSARLRKQDDLSAEDAQLLTSDRDIRELMGARDLYIADVFDVDSTGHTARPFGRVFYTRHKSLIFYAFDLDKQRDAHSVSTFQAWGRRRLGDDHPINMGIFYLDSETNRRWVLKFDDPNRLDAIETVFVTAEPKGGSQEPRGKAFLVASLRSQPNHP